MRLLPPQPLSLCPPLSLSLSLSRQHQERQDHQQQGRRVRWPQGGELLQTPTTPPRAAARSSAQSFGEDLVTLAWRGPS